MEEEIIIIEEEEEQEIIIVENDIEILAPATQEKAITPTKEEQVLTPDDGYTGLSKVTVDPIPDNYIEPTGTIDITKDGQYNVSQYANANVDFDTSDATATTQDIAEGKTAYIGEGLVTGTGKLEKPVTKGVRIDSYDEEGFANEVTIIGFDAIPNYFMNYAGRVSSSSRGWFSGTNAKLNLSNGITRIGTYAFAECHSIATIELPESLTSIEDRAFNNCNKLILTELPSEVTSLGVYTFGSCSKLALTELPESLTYIGNYCFYRCTNLTRLIIHGAIETIDNRAFYMSNLTTLILQDITSIPTMTSPAFEDTPIAKGTGYIYVPDNLVEDFKVATNWSTYANQIKGVSELV